MSKRNSWTEAEDNIIREAVFLTGQKKWTKISKRIKDTLSIQDKTGKQCRERWHNHLNPNISKENWTPEEISTIFKLHKQFGNKWSEISLHLPGRTDNSIKNFFYSTVRKNLRKFNRKKPESEKLKGSIKKLLMKPHVQKILLKGISKKTETGKKGETETELFKAKDLPSVPASNFEYPETPSTSHSVTTGNASKRFFDFSEDFLSYFQVLNEDYSKVLISQANFALQLEALDLFYTQFGFNSNN